jgi:uncharacterized protein
MRSTGPTLELSASDLSYFLARRHRTGLDLAFAQGIRAAPSWVDAALVLLQGRGLDHERMHVEQLLNRRSDSARWGGCGFRSGGIKCGRQGEIRDEALQLMGTW